MSKKGYLLIEALMGLFLLGIILVICLPILNTGVNNINMTKEKMQMLLVAESIIEQMKAFDYSWTDDEYIFDMRLKALMDLLNNSDVILIKLPLDNESQDFDYSCTIYKENNSDGLWELRVDVIPKNINRRIKNINLTTLIPAPIKDGI